MELHQLEYVLAVAKYNGFTRAAEEIKTSQSSLSQQISKLENELGVSLFARTTRSVQLTPAGKEFITHARQIMSTINEAQRCISEYASFEKGHLLLGIIPIIGHYRIPNLMASFKKNFPRVTLSLLEDQDDELYGMLRSSKIDAAFVHHAVTDSRLKLYPIVTDQMVVVTSEHHPFAGCKSVALKNLKYENIILPPPSSGHHIDFCNACRSAGFEPNILITCSSVKTILGFVREELGIAVLSSDVAAMDWERGIRTISLTPIIKQNLYLTTLNNANLPPALEVFIKFTAQWIDSHNC